MCYLELLWLPHMCICHVVAKLVISLANAVTFYTCRTSCPINLEQHDHKDVYTDINYTYTDINYTYTTNRGRIQNVVTIVW